MPDVFSLYLCNKANEGVDVLTEDLAALLTKLQTLDPATYNLLNRRSVNMTLPETSLLSMYIIQGEVQRAIAARRWESETIINPRNSDGKIIYLSWVTPRTQVKCYPHLGLETSESIEGDGSILEWRNGCKTGSYGDNQAHALRAAYIACLGATHEI